jgi:hypothetical protein
MENSSAGQSMCIGGDGAGVAGLGPPFLSLSLFPFFLSFSLPCIYARLCVAAKEEACQHTAPLLVHPLRVKPTRERERERERDREINGGH